jgi:LytS/YehU family sensor histidine kinase
MTLLPLVENAVRQDRQQRRRRIEVSVNLRGDRCHLTVATPASTQAW